MAKPPFKPFPKPPKLSKLIGPSFILVGLGLGSGELILWPYLASKYGLGIMWGALLGITFQFFINMEIERYALATGESIFVGLNKKIKILSPLWFILSTIIPWMWPGIIASSGLLIASILGIEYTKVIPITLLLVIGLILTLGPVIYKTQEIFQKTLIFLGVPFVFLLAVFLAKGPDWQNLAMGLIGKGTNFWFLPAGVSIASFLGAFAYAGAGGNLNLAQSFYIKEKGYGMGKYSGRITSILTGKKEDIKLEGVSFKKSVENLKKFRLWWKRVNTEHLIIFWATGLVTMVMLSLLSYVTVFGKNLGTGIEFVTKEASIISSSTFGFIGTLFLVVASLMLFSTQFSVMDATSRIMSENLCILSKKRFPVKNIPKYYYFFLWSLIILGIGVFAFGMTEPLNLVIIGAVLNAFAMFVYTGLVLWANLTLLTKKIRPGFARITMLVFAFLFYGTFSIFTILQYI